MPRLSTPSFRFLPLLGVAAVLLGLLAAPAGPVQAAATTGDVAPPAEPLSNYEVTTGHALTRDCGYSTPVLSRQDLWLFCDTIDYDPSGNIVSAVLGTDTSAEAPLVAGEVPQDLSEVPTPPAPASFPNDNGPSPVLPVPTGVVLPASSSACVGPNPSPNGVYGANSPDIYPASWITGVSQEPAGSGAAPGDVLITFNNYCVDGETGDVNTLFTDEAFGVVSYDPATNQLGTPTYVFTSSGGQNLPITEQLSNPVFFGGYLYLFGFQCTSSAFGVCETGNIDLARARASGGAFRHSASYQFWTGSGWSANAPDAGNLISGVTPLSISAGNYQAVGHGLVLTAESDLDGDFQVWTASSPTGPWALLQTGEVPSTCSGGEFGCYALIGHPELSTNSDLLLSYFDPGGLGHLHLAAFPWGSTTASARAATAASGHQAPAAPTTLGAWPPGIVTRPVLSGQKG